ITVLPYRPLRCCGRFWVWATHRLPAASGISPSQSHSCCYADSANIATPSPHSDGRSPAAGSCLESRSTGSARVASRTASDIGIAEALAVVATPLPQRLLGPPEPFPGCSAFDSPKPPTCSCPVMGEAEKLECAVPMRRGLTGCGLPEYDQRRLR